MIKLTDLQKRYGDRVVLDIPALTVLEGERYVLLGANGSGKSTLLTILAGICRQDAGTVASSLDLSEVAFLPQTPYAFDLTVLQNVMLPLGRGGARREQALAALERVGLAEFAQARANKLSGGETQRMALARVMAKPHRLLLLDEPTAAADITAIDWIERALLSYCAEHRCTLVMSSHAPSQAHRLASQVIFLDHGRIAEQGTTDGVLLNPQNEFAKTFLQHWKI